MDVLTKAAELFRDNIVPAHAKIQTAVNLSTYQPFNADAVNVLSAAGNFNSVVECSTQFCLRVINRQLTPKESPVAPLNKEEVTKLKSSGTTFSSSLNSIETEVGTPVVSINSQPQSLQLLADNKVRIVYACQAWLKFTKVTIAEPDFRQWPWDLFFDPRTLGMSLPPTGPVFTSPVVFSSDYGTSQNQMMSNQAALQADGELSYTRRRDFEYIDRGTLDYLNQRLGTFTLTIECQYTKSVNSSVGIVNVLLDLSEATYTLQLNEQQSDLDKLINADLLGDGGEQLWAYFRSFHSLKLVPTVCAVGKSNPTNRAITEFPNFEALVFHINGTGDAQALVIAFNIQAGCKGVIEDVMHFIGSHDYGVLSDEFLIDKVFKFKWRIGGFRRQLFIRKPIEIARNNRKENATLEGHISLNTLDFVLLATDSNTRADQLKVGGKGNSRADRIVLNDGNIVRPGDDPGLDFGGDRSMDWSIATNPSLVYVPDPEPELRQFIERMHTDGLRHISRPFAYFGDSDIRIEYLRLESVPKYFYALAGCTRLFS